MSKHERLSLSLSILIAQSTGHVNVAFEEGKRFLSIDVEENSRFIISNEIRLLDKFDAYFHQHPSTVHIKYPHVHPTYLHDFLCYDIRIPIYFPLFFFGL